MELTILAVPGCPNAPLLYERLVEALDGRPAGEITRVPVTDAEQAGRLGMHGSPTLLVDGTDPFPGPGPSAGLSCRLYRTAGGTAEGAPTVEQLRQALRS